MKWTISRACIEWSVDPKTLKKGLSERGILKREKGENYTTLQICAGIYGDLDFERTLETRARRKALEAEQLERDAVTIVMEEAQQIYTEALLPVRQRLLAMPSECATRANPTDPKFARDALQGWVDSALTLIRAKLPKPKKKKK